MSLWPGVDGAAVTPPSLGGGGVPGEVVPLWWDPNAVGLPVVAAYRAIGTVGSPWPLAPIVYADTLQNWANPGTFDLTENNGVVPWALNTGWQHVTAQQKSFDTNINTHASTWSITIRWTNNVPVPTMGVMGAFAGLNNRFDITMTPVGGMFYDNAVTFGSGTPVQVAAAAGFADRNAYLNGVPDGVMGAAVAVPALNIFIGALNSGGAANFWPTSYIESVAIYSADITAQIPAVQAAQAVL